MANAKVQPDIVIDRLLAVFRALGYDGASMADLAAATGLKKASLYHRFPEGKQAMARAVLDHLDEWTKENLTEVAFSTTPVNERIEVVLDHVRQLYKGGTVACVYRAFSHGTAAPLFQETVAAQFRTWMDAFTHLAKEAGFAEEMAQRLGGEAVVRIQGVLILSQTMDRPELFDQTLKDLRTQFDWN